MKKASKPDMRLRDAADLMRTLGNVNRLFIVCKLAEGEQSVSALEAALGIRQPVLSQQLSELRDAGIVVPRREAKSVYYRLSDPLTTRLVAALHEIYCLKNPTFATRSVVAEKSTTLMQAAVFGRVHVN